PAGPGDVSSETKEILVPASALRCRICETEHALEAVGICSRCFGPLDPVYDRTAPPTRAQIEAGPPSLWRYAPFLPVAAPEDLRLPPGLTPLVRAPRLPSGGGGGGRCLKRGSGRPA